MRILLLSSVYPGLPHHGLSLRVLGFARPLADRHEMHLCYFGDETPNSEFTQIFKSIAALPKPRMRPVPGPIHALKLLLGQPMYMRSTEVAPYMCNMLSSKSIDVVWESGGMFSPNLPDAAWRVPVVCDEVDSFVLQSEREYRVAHGFRNRASRKLALYNQLLTDRKFLPKASAVVFATTEDAAVCRRTSGARRVEVVENGVDTDYFRPAKGPVGPYEIVIEGSMAHGPNSEGAIYFALTILPLVQRQFPTAHLTIVGRDPPPALAALQSQSITVTGTVPDVRPYLDRAAVFVSPLLSGVGIKNKVLQAWSMNLPVVATSLSLGGLLARDDVNILIRDDPEGFADAVVTVLLDPGLGTRLGNAARETVLRHYSWRTKSSAMEEVLKSVCAQAK